MSGKILGATACAAAVLAALCGTAVADALTRASCWTFTYDTEIWRKMCFSESSRVTMRNQNRVQNTTNFSRCEWTGEYFRRGDKVTVTFAQGSGKCSNGAASPQFTAVCDFTGDSLACNGSSVVNGKTYEISGTFE